MSRPVLDGGSFQMRPLTAQDVHALHALTGTPTLTETAERLDTFLQHWDVYGIGPWLLWRGQPDGVVGMCGIYRLPGWDHPSLAYVLAPAARGQGLATRAGALALGHAFDVLGLPTVWALVAPENAASQAVLGRLGFSQDGSLTRHGKTSLLMVLQATARVPRAT